MNFVYEPNCATIYEDPLLKNPPSIKPLPETLKTSEEIAKYIRFDLESTQAAARFAKEAEKQFIDSLMEANKGERKHRIFIACPSHRDIGSYITMLLDALLDKDIPVVRIKRHAGELETEHVIARMITPGMHREGLRCDECFGFPASEAIFLKKTHDPGRHRLSDVPRYIEIIEKEKAKEMNFHMNYDPVARACAAISASKKPAIKNVIFNDPATIVMWSDGTKTVVKAENEPFDPEKGLAMAYVKKFEGNQGNYYNLFRKWLPEKKTD